MKRTPLKRKTPLRAKRKPSRSQAARELMELPILCVVCRATPAQHAHHRRLRSQGGADTKANLIPVCHADHRRIHDFPAWAAMEGFIVQRGHPEYDSLGKERHA